jgi:hypothetical protein
MAYEIYPDMDIWPCRHDHEPPGTRPFSLPVKYILLLKALIGEDTLINGGVARRLLNIKTFGTGMK